MDEKQNRQTENEQDNNQDNILNQSPEDEREFFERQYFSGDTLKEAEGNDGEEEQEYYETLEQTGGRKKAKAPTGMKARIIVLTAVFLVAAILLGVYELWLKPSAKGPDFAVYRLSDNCYTILGQINDKVEILFKDTKETLENSDYGKFVLAFARTFEYEFKNVSVVYGEGNAYCTVKSSDKSETFNEEEFFNTLENGTRFSFNGEILFGTAILEVTGRNDLGNAESFLKWALPGYDLDGDILSTTNRPFVYPSITRADVSHVIITNKYGSYKAYRIKNGNKYSSEFYFENAEFCQYDQEKFAAFIVNCTYMLSLGKVQNPKSLSDYGLGSEEEAQAIIELNTVDGKYHKILIGNEIPSTKSYYAKYYNKDFVYILDSSYGANVLSPLTAILTANLGYVISSPNDSYYINEVFIKYNDTNTDLYITQKQDLVLSSNMESSSTKSTINEILHDKKRLKGDYADWTSDAKTFIGMKSKDGKDMVIQMNLTNYAIKTNEYGIKFGLVRDSAKGAYLPVSVKVEVYAPQKTNDSDGEESGEEQPAATYAEVGKIDVFDQGEGSYRQYELNFTYDKPIRAIRITITPSPEGNYVVMDELTAYADGKDAIPNEAVTGVWKILSPENFIHPGTHYTVPDPSSFSDTLYGIATLVGDEVVEYNVYNEDRTEEETEELLNKYFLDEPNKVIYYKYQNYKSYIYVSSLQKSETGDEKWYYAFATVSYTDEKGEEYNYSPNTIVKIKHDTAPYLGWSVSDLVDRSAFTMYIDMIDTIEMEFGGKEYKFDLLDTNDDGKLDKVAYNNGYVDTQNFRHLYISVLDCSRAGIYAPAEEEITKDKLIFRFTMHSEVKDTEIKFYQVSSSKVLYQINGEYSESYVLYSDISTVMKNVIKLINGEEVPR